jgi:hypothetical protein
MESGPHAISTIQHQRVPTLRGARAFWGRRGFVQVDTIDPLPGWQPGNPSAIYIAALGARR